MQEGFEPWRPGISADDPEGIVAEALDSEARRAPEAAPDSDQDECARVLATASDSARRGARAAQAHPWTTDRSRRSMRGRRGQRLVLVRRTRLARLEVTTRAGRRRRIGARCGDSAARHRTALVLGAQPLARTLTRRSGRDASMKAPRELPVRSARRISGNLVRRRMCVTACPSQSPTIQARV
jgi:hypothetical protein